ncbi:MAG: hypothetical protein A2049_00500 [Elusimicrobia bacterium GWA2_62_23]|nr:MAG: hypothetical protein A2049_00500 [Elusimicrobia bacterium GWA2_62_23]OGR68465.1 MAG: hypothetical protein A2179_06045 [Elusimicrobia bacterium GWC2_63_65]
MKKNVIAAAVLALMCTGAHASQQALEALNRAAGAEAIKSVSIQEPAARQAPAGGLRGGTWVYANTEGCVVTAEQRNNGVMVYVQDGRGQQATLGFLNNYSGGDIFAYCSPARTELKGGALTLSCGEQNNGGYSTRGAAVIEMNGGITGVSVKGEVKRALGWKTDTQISCGGLVPARDKGQRGLKAYRPDWPVFMNVEACSAVDGIYPEGMTGQEGLDMLEACFAGISSMYKVPVTLAAGDEGLAVIVGKSEEMGGNAEVAAALRRELAKRGDRLFDLKVSLSVAK